MIRQFLKAVHTRLSDYCGSNDKLSYPLYIKSFCLRVENRLSGKIQNIGWPRSVRTLENVRA